MSLEKKLESMKYSDIPERLRDQASTHAKLFYSSCGAITIRVDFIVKGVGVQAEAYFGHIDELDQTFEENEIKSPDDIVEFLQQYENTFFYAIEGFFDYMQDDIDWELSVSELATPYNRGFGLPVLYGFITGEKTAEAA